MSNKRQQFKDAAKDAAKSLAHLVGVPVDRMSKRIEEIADVFNPGSLIDVRLNRMADHIEDIQRMIREACGTEYVEELDQLQRSLGDLTQALRHQSQSRVQPSSFRQATNAESLLEESSDQLTQYLSVFNVRMTARNGAAQRTVRQRVEAHGTKLEAHETKIELLECKLMSQTKEDQLVDLSEIIPYEELRDLSVKGRVRDCSGVVTRIEEATYKNQLVVVKTFVDKPEIAMRAWISEIKRYKRYRHANTERMRGVSPASETRPYIIVFPEGADIRQYFQSRRNIADVYNFLDSITKACGDLFQMGCYNWDSISVYPGGRPMLKPTFEDSRNLDHALIGIAERATSSFFGRETIRVADAHKSGELKRKLTAILQSRMIPEVRTYLAEIEYIDGLWWQACETITELERLIDVMRDQMQRHEMRMHFRPRRGDEYRVEISHVELRQTPLDSIPELLGNLGLLPGTSSHSVSNQTTHDTIFGIQSVTPYLVADGGGVWPTALTLIMASQSDATMAERLRADLMEWDAQSMVDWEHSLLEVMASHAAPPASTNRWQPRQLEYMPNDRLAIGDICSFGHDSNRQTYSKTTYNPTYNLPTYGIPTSTVVSWNGKVVNPTVSASGEWTSFTIPQKLKLPWFERIPDKSTHFAIDIYTNLPTEAMQRLLWCNVRRDLDSDSPVNEQSLSELEAVIGTHLQARIKWRPAVIKPLGSTVGVERDSGAKSGSGEEDKFSDSDSGPGDDNDNAFPEGAIHFHRNESSASPREFWGFFSLNLDPNAETGVEHCEVKYTVELTTIPMENDMDRELKRRDKERMDGMPGSYRWD